MKLLVASIDYFQKMRAYSTWILQRLEQGDLLSWSLISSILLSLALFYWEGKEVGASNYVTLPLFFIIFINYFIYGRYVLFSAPFLSRRAISLPFLFVLGFITQNTLLFILFSLFPWALKNDFYILLLAGVLSLRVKRKKEKIIRKSSLLPTLLLFIISFLGTTLLCSDFINPYDNHGGDVSIHAYYDCFTHARYIGALANTSTRLFSTPSLDDASIHMHPYHYSSYLPSAVIESVSGLHPLDILHFCLIPMGLLLLICALYSLTELVWGSWIGLVGGLAVLLIPDGYYQGMENKFYSFTFMMIIVPGLMYGVACAALSWLFVLRGVRTGVWQCILIGWAFTLALVTYKAQLFVAIAGPIFLYPLCYYPRIIWSVRLSLLLLTIVQGFILLHQLQKFPFLPTLIFDGSGLDYMMSGFLDSLDSEYLHNICASVSGNHGAFGLKYLEMAIFETVAELGPLGIAVAVASFFVRWHPAYRYFSLFAIVTYYCMSLGLALNSKLSGYSAEELIQRPFVWFYSVIIAWSLSGVVAAWLRRRYSLRKSKTRLWIISGLMFCLIFPYRESFGLQTLPIWRKYYREIPSGLMECCNYIRDKTDKKALIMDRLGDPSLEISCLSERQDFDTLYRDKQLLTTQELELAVLFKRNDANQIALFMIDHHVDYLIWEPNIPLVINSPAIQVVLTTQTGYKVLRFVNPLSNDYFGPPASARDKAH